MASEFEEKLRQILSAETTDLLELAKIAGLNPSKDFIGADLSNVNLEGADLQEFNLTYANLSHANLNHANLSYANFSHSDLRCANLQKTKLTATNFNYADLRGVDWGNSNRASASFYGAKTDYPLGGRGESESMSENYDSVHLPSSPRVEIEGDISLGE